MNDISDMLKMVKNQCAWLFSTEIYIYLFYQLLRGTFDIVYPSSKNIRGVSPCPSPRIDAYASDDP